MQSLSHQSLHCLQRSVEIPCLICPLVEKAVSAWDINRGSDMSVHVLLNLLNELGKRDKMRGLPTILSLLRNEFNKFNNTGAQMLDSIYHMKLSIL